MRTSLWLVVVFAIFLVAVSSASTYSAERGPSLQIDPLVVERVVAPGQQLSFEVSVANLDQLNSVTLEAECMDIGENLRGAYTFAPLNSTPYSLSRWVTVSPTRFTIPPGGSQSVKVTVSVPRGVRGGRYGAIAVTTVPSSADGDPDAMMSSVFRYRMASFMELVVAGAAPRIEAYAESLRVELSSAYPELRSLVGDNALVFTATVRNESDVHIVTYGSLAIATSDGRTVARHPLGGGRGVILPGASVELRSVIRSPLPSGEYTAKFVVDYGARRPIVAATNFEVDEQAVIAKAQQQSSRQRFAVEPDQLHMTLMPGSMRSAIIEVSNRGDEDLVVLGQVLPLAYDSLGVLLPSEHRAGGLGWVTVSPEEVRVRPGMSTRVRVTARAPADASGGYYADIVFAPEGSGLRTEAGSSLFVFVGGSDADIVRRGSLEPATVIIDESSLSVDAWFVNEGNVHLNLTGTLHLMRRYPQTELEGGLVIGAREEQVASVELDASGNPVLPGTERILRFMMPVDLEDGEYELAVRVDYGGDGPAIARLRFSLEGGIASEIIE